MKSYTVVCSYLNQSQGISPPQFEARLYYDVVQARTPELAVAKATPSCPATPADILVFEGEMYDTGREAT